MSTGISHACALTTSGAVQCWGRNKYGQLENNSTEDSPVPVAVSGLSSGVVAIATGEAYTCALTTAGGVLCWGGERGLLPVAVSGLSSGVVAIATGKAHTCALTTAGGVLCWGVNWSGQLGNNSTEDSPVPVAVSGLSSGVVAIATGGEHTCALTTAGGVLCWGQNLFGQLGNGSKEDSHVPVPVSGLSSGVAAVSAGNLHTCALTTAGGVLCWGENLFGQLGNDSREDSPVPVPVSGLSSGVAAVDVGLAATCAVMTGGDVQCWGVNDYGKLGNSEWGERLVPVPVMGLSSGVAAVDLGAFFTCALTTAGRVLCLGKNDWGQLGNNSTENSFAPVSVIEP
ncbi:RCC1 domain-containing protein [Sorangium sp. So ce1128]